MNYLQFFMMLPLRLSAIHTLLVRILCWVLVVFGWRHNDIGRVEHDVVDRGQVLVLVRILCCWVLVVSNPGHQVCEGWQVSRTDLVANLTIRRIGRVQQVAYSLRILTFCGRCL